MSVVGTVFVIDDDPNIRDLIDAALRRANLAVHLYPSAEAFAGVDILKESGSLPSCILLDLVMPGISGLDLLEKQFTGGTACPVIVMTARGTIQTAVKSMKLGAVDFLEKPFSPESLTSLVFETLKKYQGSQELLQSREIARKRIASLSPREAELLDAIILGKSTKMIADNLGISARTVDHHRANLMAKMEATNVADLVRMAVQAEFKYLKRPTNGPALSPAM